MDLGLKAKRALVLGSSSGLGKAIGLKLVQEGAIVALAGRDKERLAKAVDETGAATFVSGDLTVDGEAARMAVQAAEFFSGLDILVVNTGGGGAGHLGLTTADIRESAFRSILRPALDAALAAAPYLRESGNGRMVFIAARSVLEASTDLALSSVYRSGVTAAARSLAVELAPEVLVNVVVPGQFETPAYDKFRSWLAQRDNVSQEIISRRHLSDIPLGRYGLADELADVVVFLCSARASYVSGSVVRVDGGAVKGFH